MDTISEAAEWQSLNDRQKAHAEALAELALEYGKFDQSSGADGAHYAPAAVNPFKPEGLKCGNCIFFDELTNGCQIVVGKIEPEAICKLWVIPEASITLSQSQLTRADLAKMTDAQIMAARKQGRLDSLLGKTN